MRDEKPDPFKYDAALRELKDLDETILIDRHATLNSIWLDIRKRIRILEDMRSREIVRGMTK